jgi:hypothetical protein
VLWERVYHSFASTPAVFHRCRMQNSLQNVVRRQKSAQPAKCLMLRDENENDGACKRVVRSAGNLLFDGSTMLNH